MHKCRGGVVDTQDKRFGIRSYPEGGKRKTAEKINNFMTLIIPEGIVWLQTPERRSQKNNNKKTQKASFQRKS